MSRPYDWTLVGVISIISVLIHTISVELFGPQSILHQQANTATHFDAAARVDQWFEILAVWAPMIAIVGIILWALFREYRRQTVGTVQRARP